MPQQDLSPSDPHPVSQVSQLTAEFSAIKGFGSDNHSAAHPLIMQALSESNSGHLPSYGTDLLTEKVSEAMNQLFGQEVSVYFVFNGTAANTLALKAMTRGFHSVICSDSAHIHHDECGAPEALAGCKLIPLKTEHGKITAQQVEEALIRRGDQHATQPAVVSLSQSTELGTCYQASEIKEIVEVAHQNGLFVHVDGARIANAVVSEGSSFREMLTETGVDVLSFGGTKNGFVFGEAVVFFNRELARDFKYIRKQGLNLPSKSRFVAAQFLRYLEGDLWQDIAQHSLGRAKELEHQLADVPGLEITHPVQSNAVFAKIPRAWLKQVRKKYFFYIWDEKTFEARIMTSFDTTGEDISGLAAALKEASRSS